MAVELNAEYHVSFGYRYGTIGTAPRDMRLWIPDAADTSEGFILKIQYTSSDVHKRVSSGAQVFVDGIAAQLSQDVVTMADTAGSYHWNMMDRVLSVTVKGNKILTVRTQNAVKTSLLVQTSIAEFFSAQASFIDLLAGVLNIPASTIRIVEIIEAPSRRRLLQSGLQLSFAVAVLDELNTLADTIQLAVSSGALTAAVASDATLSSIVTVPVQEVTSELSLSPDPECLPTCKNTTLGLENE
eukprot:scaffold96075_cov44-Prasinocladus_malaysianus.AAC.1